MVSVDKAVIARLTTHGQHFEILVDCDNSLAVKEGKELDMQDVLAVSKIYTDSHKAIEAPESALNQVFQTTDATEIAKQIIKKGEIQLTQEYREKLRVQKRNQVINIIQSNGVDPKTHLPHPRTRIENAFEEAKVHITEFDSVDQQVQAALKKLRPILPIKFEIKEIAIKISAEHAPKCYSIVKSHGTMLREDWQTDGSWQVVLEIPGGIENELYDKLNKVCHGSVESKVLKTK